MQDNEIQDEHYQNRAVPLEIIDEARKSVCKIITKQNKATGTFLDLTNIIDKKCLITNCHVISEELVKSKSTITIEYGKEKEKMKKDIELDNEKLYIKIFPSFDITIIEIIDEDLLKKVKFLNIDKNYLKGYERYINKNIFIMEYPLGGDLNIDIGSISTVKSEENYFRYKLDTQPGSSGSPILLLDNSLVGIHKGAINEKEKAGIFIGHIINELKKEKISKILSSLSPSNNNNKKIYNEKIDQICSKLNKFSQQYNEFERNLDNKTTLNLLLKHLEHSRALYILMLGEDNSEIISFLNGLLECKILPEGSKKKNIIIKYCNSDDIILKKSKMIYENDVDKLDLNGDPIAVGLEEIRCILNSKKSSKEEFLYEIDINIKSFNKLYEKDIKGDLCLIYLPNRSPIRNAYEKILENCNIFLHITNNAEKYIFNQKKFLDKFYNLFKQDSYEQFITQFIQRSRFIINNKKEKDDNSLDQAKKYLIKGLMETTKEKIKVFEEKDIFAGYLNIGLYEKFTNNYFESLKIFLYNEYNKYKEEGTKTGKKFGEYLIEKFKIDSTSTSFSIIDDNQFEPQEDIENSISIDFDEIYKFDEKEFNLIKKYFSKMKEYLSKECLMNNIITEFVKDLEIIILRLGQNNEFKQYINKLTVEKLDPVFNIEPDIKIPTPEIIAQNEQLKSGHLNAKSYIEEIFPKIYSKIEETKNEIMIYKNYDRERMVTENIDENTIILLFKNKLNELVQQLSDIKNTVDNYLQYIEHQLGNESCEMIRYLFYEIDNIMKELSRFTYKIESLAKVANDLKNCKDYESYVCSWINYFFNGYKGQKVANINYHLEKETENELDKISSKFKEKQIYIQQCINDKLKRCEKNNQEKEKFEKKKQEWQTIQNAYNDLKRDLNSI